MAQRKWKEIASDSIKNERKWREMSSRYGSEYWKCFENKSPDKEEEKAEICCLIINALSLIDEVNVFDVHWI